MKRIRLMECLCLAALLALPACGSPAGYPEPLMTSTAPAATDTLAPPAATHTPAPRPTETPPPTSTRTPAPTGASAPPTPTSDPRPRIQPLGIGQPVTITQVHLLDALSGWAVGQGPDGLDDHVLRTADGGRTWTDVTPPEPLGDLSEGGRRALAYFQDEANAWVTFSSGFQLATAYPRMWRTRDGGLSWSLSEPINLISDSIYFPSHLIFAGDTGWLLAHVGAGMMHDYVNLLGAADGGQTWTTLVDPFGETLTMSCYKTGLALAPDAQTGWLTGDCGGVVPGAPQFQVTADGGHTWAQLDLPAPADQPELFLSETMACGAFWPDLSAAPAGRLVLQCLDYSQAEPVYLDWLYVSDDLGATWQATRLAGPVASLHFSGDSGWLQTGLSAPYQTWLTRDGGRTFTAARDLNWKGQFSFADASAGLAVAADDDGALALVASADGGQKWQVLQPVIGP